MNCKGRCTHLVVNGKKYVNGYKFCSVCQVWILTTDNRCSCCSMILRTRPRTRKAKKNIAVYEVRTN
mgnify:CR=1 FL=1